MAEFRLDTGSDGVFYAAGELDLLSADQLEEQVADALRRGGDLVLDLAHLTFVDSTGIRAFIRIAQRITPRCLVLRRPNANVAHVLEIVGIHSFGIRVEHEQAE